MSPPPTNPVRNPVKDLLAAGQNAWGVNVRFVRNPEVARLMAHAGYHWLFLDLEHSAMSFETVNQMCLAALDAGIVGLVRVPQGEYGMATRVLDNGALGIVMPAVETADEARELVRRVRYAPHGKRGISTVVPYFHYAAISAHELARELNDATLVIAMVETAEGIANVDAIAAVPGIDIIFVGASDLSFSIGAPDTGAPAVHAAILKVAAACRAQGKVLGIGGVRDAAKLAEYAALGARFLLGGSDVGMLASTAQTQLKTLQAKVAGKASG